MLILGFNGSLSLINENKFNIGYGESHDAAAVLIKDGKIIAAFEEERLNRIKHTNKMPLLSIKACLEKANVTVDEIDAISIPCEEDHLNGNLGEYRRMDRDFTCSSARDFVGNIFRQHFGADIDQKKICFVNHHLAHAASSYYLSGFNNSLIITLDGSGDNLAGGVYLADGNVIETIRVFPQDKSIGHLYLEVTRLLGFDNFDEYKVMGLAPYGDITRYQSVFERLYTLLPDGDYEIDWGMAKKLKMHLPFRKKNEPFTEEHKDIASAIQKVTETIIFHIVRHYRQVTGATNLSLAGGVALNCTMNGKLRYAKLFDDIFVQPASHDGGIPLGATLITYYHHRPEARRSSLEHVYLGTDCPDPKTCMEIAGKWSAFLDVQPSEDVAGTAAQLIASGKVIGWFQGTSEYGPRALGNRSILADPRPAENKEIINYKIKMREGFRPFAPSILAEKTGEVFCLPDGNREYPYMSFILKVRDKYRPLLGAITHVDGTARLHTVTRETNERYYDLIEQFSLLTGIPVVLNTSFNNNAEPIVDTPDQAINCFLTTELDMLIIDTLILKKKSFTEGQLLNLYPLVFPFVRLFSAHENGVRNYFAGNTYNEKKHILSPEAYTVLKQGDGTKMLGSLLAGQDAQDIGAVLHEIKELWSSRIISMSPEEISTL